MTDPERPSLASLPAALGVFLLAMLLTAGATLFAAQSTREQERAAFESLIGRVQTAIVQRMQTYTNLMYSGRAYLLGSREISRSGWHDFVSALDLESRFPGIQGLGLAVRIPPGELAAYVAQVRRSDMPSFHVWPAGDRPELTAILYLEPMDARNRAAIGYDMYSEPVRREAMARARDTGQPALSGKVSLVQEITEAKQAGFLIYLPVYRNTPNLKTVAERRAALLGYVYAPFRADDLFTGLFGSRPHPNVDFEIYDGPPKPENLLHDHNPAVSSQPSSTTGFQLTVPTTVAGRTWTILYTATPEFAEEVDRGLIVAVFVGGTLVSLLLAGITWSLASSRSRALAMATEMTAELRKADQAKDEFLSVISHELRTPLNFIMGFGSILQDEIPGTLNPKQQEYLGKMLNGVDRMLILVNDLLDFAKIQAGKLDLLPTRTDFVPLAEEVHATLKPLADQKQLTLALDLPEHLELVADGPRIVQVLTNLVGNAIKFTPAGGRIVLRSRFDGNDLLSEVSDTGIGISPEDLPKLFTRFKQLDMSSTRRVGGTGLGLSISKAIVEGHGGSIGVRSEKDKGSTFWFRLPVDGTQA
ncbi:Signal transduction histidine-protein kinase BarA [compost metagenome]